VYQHMGSLSASPLDLVFTWLLSAFATHLAPSETLLLWDRIIGFDSLLPLPVLAVAVLVFRYVKSAARHGSHTQHIQSTTIQIHYLWWLWPAAGKAKPPQPSTLLLRSRAKASWVCMSQPAGPSVKAIERPEQHISRFNTTSHKP
jgi:hypothetical protein